MSKIERQVPTEVRRVFPALSGDFEYDGKSYDLSAHVELSNDGHLVIRGIAPPQLLDQFFNADDSFSLALASEDGWRLYCEDCWINKIQNSSSFEGSALKVTATFGQSPDPQSSHAFCVLVGGDSLFGGDCFDQFGVRSAINIGYVGRKAYLYGAKISDLEQEIGYCYLASEGVSIEQDLGDTDRLKTLLSFAYARLISTPWYGRFDGENGTIRIELTSAMYPGTGVSALYPRFPNQVSSLITRAWSRWDNEAKGLNLVHLINLYVLVRDQKFVDAALMLGSVWMEAFKHQYASQVKGYSTNAGGHFLKPGSSQRYAFKELVEEGMLHYGIPNPYTGFVGIRNEVIHTGTVTAPVLDQMKVRDKLEQAIEELLFTILDYKGMVWDRDTGNRKTRT